MKFRNLYSKKSKILIVLIFILLVACSFKKEEKKEKKKNGHFAFITSSYFLPESRILGSNALSLIMTINMLKKNSDDPEMDFYDRFKTNEIVVFAENGTDKVMVTTEFKRVKAHEKCRMVVVSANVNLIPNVKTISMVSGKEHTEIPFTTPKHKKRDVVFCIPPLFVSENWQNFLFAVHIYKHFGAHTHLYLTSSARSFYNLIREYEKDEYITLQPWTRIHFPNVTGDQLEWYDQIELRNQAASQSDCLLQYRESASFVGFLDLDEILIPNFAPTYIQEFQHYMNLHDSTSYLFYDKEKYNAKTVNQASQFSFIGMLNSLEKSSDKETGKMIIATRKLNATWVHWPAEMLAGIKKYDVKNNSIRHLSNIDLDLETFMTSPINLQISELLISKQDAELIENDLKKMLQKKLVRRILNALPKTQYYGDIVRDCYDDTIYRFIREDNLEEMKCPGPHHCEFHQHPEIQCMHVNATIYEVNQTHPITYFFAKDPVFTSEIGCYP